MYGLDKMQNLDFFVGKTLTQVCVGMYQLILNFEDGISISVESVFEYDGNSGDSSSLPESACPLLNAIGRAVELAEVGDKGALILGFTGGKALKIFDSNESTESYQIEGSGLSIVV